MDGARGERHDADAVRHATQALHIARRFLKRWRDHVTRHVADDVAQETAIEVWRSAGRLRRPECLPAFARTVCRRFRSRAVLQHLRGQMESIDADEDLADLLIDEPPAPGMLRIGGCVRPLPWGLRELDVVLECLDVLNRRIMLGFYEGFSCGELAERYCMPESAVKARLHRNRVRIRHELEGRVRAAVAEEEP